MRIRAGLTTSLIVLLLMLCYLPTLAPGLTWANDGQDGGDFAAAVATRGVAHPSGYPTYILLARLFSALPLGTPGFELNLFSALSMALAGACLGLLVMKVGGARGWGAGIVSGLVFGLAPLPWSQALITEVHALNALFLALTLLLLQAAEEGGRGRLAALGLLVGLALGNHLTFALLLPAVGLFALWQARRRGDGLIFLCWAGASLAGMLAVYAYLPLAARGNPPVNWGNPVDWAGLRWVVGGAPYQDLAFGLPASFIAGRIAAWARLLLAQFGLPGLLLIGLGLYARLPMRRWMDGLALWVIGVYSVFAIGYNTADSNGYLIPVYLAAAWWIGQGVLVAEEAIGAALSGWLKGRVRSLHTPGSAATQGKGWQAPPAARGQQPGASVGRGMLFLLLAALIAVRLPETWRSVDASLDQRAEMFIAGIREQAPQDALFFTDGTRDTFALWYLVHALEEETDLAVIVIPLAQFDWYRETIARTYPQLTWPAQFDGDVWRWAEDVEKANLLPVCRSYEAIEAHGFTVTFECSRLD